MKCHRMVMALRQNDRIFFALLHTFLSRVKCLNEYWLIFIIICTQYILPYFHPGGIATHQDRSSLLYAQLPRFTAAWHCVPHSLVYSAATPLASQRWPAIHRQQTTSRMATSIARVTQLSSPCAQRTSTLASGRPFSRTSYQMTQVLMIPCNAILLRARKCPMLSSPWPLQNSIGTGPFLENTSVFWKSVLWSHTRSRCCWWRWQVWGHSIDARDCLTEWWRLAWETARVEVGYWP